jgi:hypothetical protein
LDGFGQADNIEEIIWRHGILNYLWLQFVIIIFTKNTHNCSLLQESSISFLPNKININYNNENRKAEYGKEVKISC